jgi:hypothetical protein
MLQTQTDNTAREGVRGWGALGAAPSVSTIGQAALRSEVGCGSPHTNE